MDEARVDAERDVVEEEAAVHARDVDAPLDPVERRERGERVLGVEAHVAGEVVPRAEGDADEGEVALERHLRHGAEGAVTARGPQNGRPSAGGLARERLRVVALAELPRLDAEARRFRGELLGRRRPRAGARVDEEEGAGSGQRAGGR